MNAKYIVILCIVWGAALFFLGFEQGTLFQLHGDFCRHSSLDMSKSDYCKGW
jgi:hypothetical protein